MNIEDIRRLFSDAFNMKKAGDLGAASLVFLDTIREGVPVGVEVILVGDDQEKPSNLKGWRQTRPHYYAVLLLKFEESEQAIPVPILDELGGIELVDSLVQAAAYKVSDWDADTAAEEAAKDADPHHGGYRQPATVSPFEADASSHEELAAFEAHVAAEESAFDVPDYATDDDDFENWDY